MRCRRRARFRSRTFRYGSSVQQRKYKRLTVGLAERSRRRQCQGRTGQCLQAEVDQERRRLPCPSRHRTTKGRNERGASARPIHRVDIRRKGACRLQEAKARHNHQDHSLHRTQGTQVCKRDTGRGHRPHTRDAGERILANRDLQALQLQRTGCATERRCSASLEQGARGVQEDLLPPGLR